MLYYLMVMSLSGLLLFKPQKGFKNHVFWMTFLHNVTQLLCSRLPLLMHIRETAWPSKTLKIGRGLDSLLIVSDLII